MYLLGERRADTILVNEGVRRPNFIVLLPDARGKESLVVHAVVLGIDTDKAILQHERRDAVLRERWGIPVTLLLPVSDGELILVGDTVGHVPGRNMLARRVAVAPLIIKKDVRLECLEEFALIHAAKE